MPSNALTACLFDLDGTLIDSIELIFRSYEHTLRTHGLQVSTRDELLLGLGEPLKAQFARITSDPSFVEALIATYRQFNLAHHDALVKPFPGALAGVQTLKRQGLALGIVTSKRSDTARRGLDWCGFGGLFGCVVGMDDTHRHKPDPEPVLLALQRLHADPTTSAFVGDSPHDLRAGRAAGIQVFAAGWGPFPRRSFDGVPMDGWLRDPSEIGELVSALGRSAHR